MSSELTEKKCGACEKIKPIRQFYRNRVYEDGYERRCKICHQSGKKIYKGEPYPRKRAPHLQKWEDTTRLTGAQKKDYEHMYNFLIKIGYNPHDVHGDFCRKFGLEPKKRHPKNLNHYNFSDLI